jgi:thioredoxin reductase
LQGISVGEKVVSEEVYDCLVVGAGPAGLSASLFLARYHRRTLTFHFYSPRNIYSHGIHGFLGHHGILPVDLLARGQEEVTHHGGTIIEACVMRAEQLEEERFRVHIGDGEEERRTFDARRLLLTTGLRDLTPDCAGFRDFYGSTVFHCPDCDGFEVSGKRVAVLSSGKTGVALALYMLTWTDQIAFINATEEDLPDDYRNKLTKFNIPFMTQKIERLEGDLDERQLRRVVFTNGESLSCDALFFHLGTEPASQLHQMLGCKIDEESGLVWVDEKQQTDVKGVYAAGDLTPKSQLAVVAAAEGAMAAIHIHQSLIPDAQKI